MVRIVFVFMLLCGSVSNAQKNHVVYWVINHNPSVSFKQYKSFSSASTLEDAVEDQRIQLIKKGYMLANIDSLNWQSDTAYVHFYVGPKLERIVVNINEEDERLIRKIPGVSERWLQRIAFNKREIASMVKKVGDHLRDNGHPFAAVSLDVSEIKSPNTHANLVIKRGPKVNVKAIFIKGNAQINKKFIINAIAIREGDLYDQSKLNDISARVSQIQFISEIKPHELLFTEEGVEIYIYLESNPVSLVNGIVGLQPDPVTQENIITGDVRLKLQNIIKRGELFNINWRSLQPTTQDLDIRLVFPFLFNTPFGIDTKFDLYKQDSSFLTTNLNLGVQYFLRGGNYIKAFYEADNSNVLSGGVSSVENFVSVSTNRYGIGVMRQQFDYLPNPSRGLRVSVEASAGQRSSNEGNSDTLVRATTFKGSLEVDAYVPLAKRHVLRLANRTMTYYAPEIFSNEAFRFGGLQWQRGFNEEVLRATTLSTFTVEYRFLVDRNSHAFAFFDQSIYERTYDGYLKDDPFGFGAGFSFGTNIGIFSISYALGQQFDNPILIRDGKVHFGYVAFF